MKRGPLGRCEQTTVRTEQNDNDKASRYMKPMDESTREKDLAMRSNNEELSGDTSELLKRLKAKTEENKEKNARTVATKTYLNNQVCNRMRSFKSGGLLYYVKSLNQSCLLFTPFIICHETTK